MRGIVLFLVLCCGVAWADDAVSPTFTFDARYEASGMTPEAWAAYQAEGLSGRFEARTVFRAVDANENGIPDAWEKMYGLTGEDARAEADPDGDGRANLQEYNAGTNPVLADDWTRSAAASGESFVCDTRVWYTGGNPPFDEAFAVVRVSNGFICDTGGLYYDWDGDGIPNWWEARYSRTGGKTGLVANDDDDNDGLSNYGEFVAYTDPTNSASKFVIGLEQIVVAPVKVQVKSPLRLMAAQSLSSNSDSETFALKWQSALGRTYSIYTTSDLSAGWDAQPVEEIRGTGDVVEYISSQGNTVMFFKVSVRLSDDY